MRFPSPWVLSFDMKFEGANNYIHESGTSTCQFGGLYSPSNAFCETMVIQEDFVDTKHISSLFIQFYKSYSAGRVRIFLTQVSYYPISLSSIWLASCTTNHCEYDRSIWAENSFLIVGDTLKDTTMQTFFGAFPERYPLFLNEPDYKDTYSVHVRAGNEDGTVSLATIAFHLHINCSQGSSCRSTVNIQSGINMFSTQRQIHNYHGSVSLDKRVAHARSIAASINITQPQDVYIKLRFTKVQNCDYSESLHNIQQLSNGCELMELDNTLGAAYFFTQVTQWLVIGVSSECPSASCVDMIVKATPVIPMMATYYWNHTDLRYVNITVTLPALIELSWSNSAKCQANKHRLETLCSIKVMPQLAHLTDISAKRLTIVDNFAKIKLSPTVTEYFSQTT